MISNDRQTERAPFAVETPLRNCGRLQFLYPTLRQGLYQYFRGSPVRSVLMPDYVPQGVQDPFRKLGARITYYTANIDLSLDKSEFVSLVALSTPDVCVYVHHFGLYRADGVALVRSLLPEGAVLIEDFGHTLPCPGVALTGDICTYSFTKMVGVAEGSLMWFSRKSLLRQSPRSPESGDSRRLRSRLTMRLRTESFLARTYAGPRLRTAVNTLLHRLQNYYPLLMDRYAECFPRVGVHSIHALDRMNFDAVFARRKLLALRYLSGIARPFRLDLPDECFTAQALVGFPIRAPDQCAFHAHMRARGVEGFTLVDHWWFKDTVGENSLLRNHYLLPLNHYLTERDIDQVIGAVNAFRG